MARLLPTLSCATLALFLLGAFFTEAARADESAMPPVAQEISQLPPESHLDAINRQAPMDSMISDTEQSIFRKILWYIPNRVIDLVDIFKLDVGVGSSAGIVLRASRYGQMGGRFVDPGSYRVGVRGRKVPFFVERESEYGFCSNFSQTSARNITPIELGVGVDLGVGAYAGVSFDEFADFLLGFFLVDFKDDDLVPML
jgi:hypothetical protein